jgi:hypothetical protein
MNKRKIADSSSQNHAMRTRECPTVTKARFTEGANRRLLIRVRRDADTDR